MSNSGAAERPGLIAMRSHDGAVSPGRLAATVPRHAGHCHEVRADQSDRQVAEAGFDGIFVRCQVTECEPPSRLAYS